MTAIAQLTEAEMALVAIITDPSGIDFAEFCWEDVRADNPTGCFRARDYQWPWYHTADMYQIDRAGRNLGKSWGVEMRAASFPFRKPGRDMLLTAPERTHLRPLCDAIEERLLTTRLTREMMPKTRSAGISRMPSWQVSFLNGAEIISRLPQRSGKGVKGQHADEIEGDEMQDYPAAGWENLWECFNRASVGARMWMHGVSRGARDTYYNLTEKAKDWHVHHYKAMHRPTWGPGERQEKVDQYGGSRSNPGYVRNIYGLHGDAASPIFVMSRLYRNVDDREDSIYNAEVFQQVKFEEEVLADEFQGTASGLDLNPLHLLGWKGDDPKSEEQKQRGGAPNGYEAYYGGMDVGVTNHPSIIVIYGQRKRANKDSPIEWDLLLLVKMIRITTPDQLAVIGKVFAHYGPRLRGFAIDKNGPGNGLWQFAQQHPDFGRRIHGWNSMDKVVIGREDREPEWNETPDDLLVYENFTVYTTDVMRRDFVDPTRYLLPDHPDVLGDMSAQNDDDLPKIDPYGKSGANTRKGRFHVLDAQRMAHAAATLPRLRDEFLAAPTQEDVLPVGL